MTLPLLGPMTLSGFEQKWYFLFLLLVLGLAGLYILAQLFTPWLRLGAPVLAEAAPAAVLINRRPPC
jgi:hypothetical protein